MSINNPIKLIDAKDNLSVQVHPNDEYAFAHEGGYGKTEMWYVLDCEPNAYLYYGLNRTLTKEEFRQHIENNTILENDANAAAYGEYIANGNNVNSYIFMTLGTGVGGGIIINGKIYRGFNCAGAEIGHSSIVIDGKTCTCGKKGCLECYASVTALIEQTEEKIKECPDSLMIEWARTHGKVSGRTAFECAKVGDKAAIEVKDKYIRYIAEGVSNIINIFQPEMFVIGGGISKEGDEILAPIKQFVYKNDYNKYMPKTDIRIAKLFNDAGIIGSALAAAV